MKRGDLVTVLFRGDYGKPRPAPVVRSDVYSEIDSVVVLQLTSVVIDKPILRVTIEPNSMNGLRTVSQVMVDKPMSLPVEKIGMAVGHLSDSEMLHITSLLAPFLGIPADFGYSI